MIRNEMVLIHPPVNQEIQTLHPAGVVYRSFETSAKLGESNSVLFHKANKEKRVKCPLLTKYLLGFSPSIYTCHALCHILTGEFGFFFEILPYPNLVLRVRFFSNIVFLFPEIHVSVSGFVGGQMFINDGFTATCFKAAGNMVNTGHKCNFHVASAIGSQRSKRATFSLGRLGLPARLPFSKPKVNWLLHRSPHSKRRSWFLWGPSMPFERG